MAYTGLYNASGNIITTQVSGSVYTGLYSPDGNWNIVINDGSTIKGRYHPCGALNAVVVADSFAPAMAANGSINVILNSSGGYSPTPITGTAPSGVPVIPSQGWGTVNRLRGMYPFISGSYTSNIAAWETWLGGTADFVLIYATGPTSVVLLSNLDAQIASVAPSNKVLHTSVGIPANTTIADINSGSLDSMFTSIANKIIAARPGDTFYTIRPLWEAQNISIGSWYAVGQEAAYITAFRRITQIFLTISLKFRIDWTMNETTSVSGSPYNPTLLYPGDQYVDLIGQDFYWINAFNGTDPNVAFRLKQSDTYGLNFISAFARTHNKPMSLGEWGVNYDGPQYVSLMLEYCAQNNVAFQAYFNADNGGNFNNRLDLNQYPNVSTRFKIEFAAATTITNVLSNGNTFTSAPWAGVGNGIASVTTGQTDPLSGTTASTLLETSATSTHIMNAASQTVSATSGLFRLYNSAKPNNGRNWLQHNIGQNTFGAGTVAYYDLVNQVPGATFFGYGGMNNVVPGAIPENNGFTKTVVEFTSADTFTDLQPLLQLATADNTNSYTGDITKGIDLNNVVLRRLSNYTPSYSAEALAVFAAMTTPPSTARKNLIDNLIVGLKTDGVWTLLTSLQIYAAADSQAALVDWANVSRVPTLTAAPTFTADNGFTTNGTTQFIDTLVNPTSSVGSNGTTAAMGQNSNSMSSWCLTNVQMAASPVGWFASQGFTIQPRSTTDQFSYRASVSTATLGASTDARGHWNTFRTGATSEGLYKNGVTAGSDGNTSAALVSATLRVGSSGAASFSANQFAMFHAGSSMTPTQRLAFYNRLRTYMTGVGVP